MGKELLAAVSHAPEVYESTGLTLWDDDHISKMMLENHLSPDSAGATREHAQVKASAEWLASLLSTGGSLLDLGCGPGIYAELLSERGFTVTGIDISRRSIEYAQQSAREKGLDIVYSCSDYRTLNLDASKFDMAILIYCDYGVLAPNERRKLLKTVFEALKPGGIFVLDVFSSGQYREWSDGTGFDYEEGGFWNSEPYTALTIKKSYPNRHYLERYIVVTENDCLSYNIWNHAFLDSELVTELKNAGFNDVELFSDVTGGSFTKESNTICAVAKKG